MKPKIGLVLSGGGARGAYQVGVLQGILDIMERHKLEPNFRIITGVSAGAINAAYLASCADDFPKAVRRLTELWSNIRTEDVFAADAVNVGKIAMTWAADLGFGSFLGTTPGKAMLDTRPLRQLLLNNLDLSSISKHLAAGHLDALALTAVDYSTSNSITFIHGRDETPGWKKSRRWSEKMSIGVDHVMASSAIPLLFPAVQVGEHWFGDGCVRNTHPCSPAIYMGADKLIVVGVRRRGLTAYDARAIKSSQPPSVARVFNLLLNAVLLDGIELDVERLERVNEFVKRVPVAHHENLNFKTIDYAMISPSADIGEIASRKASRLPRIIRYMLKGLGGIEDAAEIVSYLLFDSEFCGQLIEIGRQDALASEADLLRVLS